MWKEKYKIGVSIIDTQHEELFNRVEVFLKTVRSGGDWGEKLPKVKETMEFMKEYVIHHFDEEEKYQEEVGYPDILNHKEEHAKFKNAVNIYAIRMETEGYGEELVQEFSGRLMAWLIIHVAAKDQKIGEYIMEQGGQVQ